MVDGMMSIPVFLVSVMVISFSGVLMPGPVFAATVAKGRTNGNAGAKVAIGHGVIEIPLMILIYLGFAQLFTYEVVRKSIGIIGGLMLVMMGLQMIRSKMLEEHRGERPPYGSIITGIITTSANPYFYLWWATIGAALVLNSTLFGLTGFVLFAITHWLVDFLWDLAISKTVYKSKKLWNNKIHRLVILVCAIILLGFGGWFILSALI